MQTGLTHWSSSIVIIALLGTGFNGAEAQAKPVPNVVQGTVSTIDGRPVAGATIRIAGATGAARGTSITAKTDANGRYRVNVPLGHYNVDGFAELQYNGQTYKELWLDRGDAPCERVMSDKGIVRNFVLRLSGTKRCTNGTDLRNPDAYYGAYITAMSSAFPDDAVITFTLTPTGPLADGTKGRTVVIKRSGAALKKGGGPIGETAFLHDIPLGRYKIAATVRYADGSQRATMVELRDGSSTTARALDIDFKANVFGGGIRSVGIGVLPSDGAVATNEDAPPVVEEPAEPAIPAEPAVEKEAETTSDAPQPEQVPAPVKGPDLPVGRYACSYRSQYAGDIPTGKFIVIRGGGQYEAYGVSGTYTVEGHVASVKWTGPLGDGDVRAAFGERNGLPTITVIGGGASEEPDRTNVCVLIK
ncbi:MAG TPA: carboxypeptidase-like regulatory domain-containing protein [Gemmatimonadaceae bacterium]|nr:carboxypeptidase-like regulatory domain-containing protein [Gemmatimonadaceae bacterium]